MLLCCVSDTNEVSHCSGNELDGSKNRSHRLCCVCVHLVTFLGLR